MRVTTPLTLSVLVIDRSASCVFAACASTAPTSTKPVAAVLRGDRLYALERSTGRALWNLTLPDGPTTAPLADDAPPQGGLYLCLGPGRIYTYALPDLEEWKRYKQRKDF